MNQPTTRYLVVALGVVAAAVVLVVSGLLLPLLVAAAVVSSVWLLGIAWAAEPAPGSVPAPRATRLPGPPVADSERLVDALRTARLIPAYALHDVEVVDDLLSAARPRTPREVDAAVARAAEAVGW